MYVLVIHQPCQPEHRFHRSVIFRDCAQYTIKSNSAVTAWTDCWWSWRKKLTFDRKSKDSGRNEPTRHVSHTVPALAQQQHNTVMIKLSQIIRSLSSNAWGSVILWKISSIFKILSFKRIWPFNHLGYINSHHFIVSKTLLNGCLGAQGAFKNRILCGGHRSVTSGSHLRATVSQHLCSCF